MVQPEADRNQVRTLTEDVAVEAIQTALRRITADSRIDSGNRLLRIKSGERSQASRNHSYTARVMMHAGDAIAEQTILISSFPKPGNRPAVAHRAKHELLNLKSVNVSHIQRVHNMSRPRW